MELAEGIRKLGFRRWYERQLIESHLYLVSGFLCLVAVLASIEGINLRTPGWETLLRVAAVIGGGIACLWACRRYLEMLGAAEHAAAHSVCEKCAAYGGLELIGMSYRGHDDGLLPVRVRCRKCGHEWTIE